MNNGTLTSAVFPNLGTGLTPETRHQYAIVDEIYRPGTYLRDRVLQPRRQSTVRPIDLSFNGQVGYTRGHGKTPKQDVFEGDVFNTGASYTFHGISSPVDVSFPNGNPSNFAGTSLDWIFGASPAKTEDKEGYGKIDGLYQLDNGPWSSLKFGLRYARARPRTRSSGAGSEFRAGSVQRRKLAGQWNGETYPSNFGERTRRQLSTHPWMLVTGRARALG